jgi:thiol-disulfide isomerase/thioredoxin
MHAFYRHLLSVFISALACSLFTAVPAASAPTSQAAPTSSAPAHPQAKLYDEKSLASRDVDAALIRAALANKRVIIVMGANWCHDSIGLAGWFVTPRFAEMLRAKYEIVYVDVGTPQTGNGRNLDIAKRYGAKKIKGTPTVLILSPQGKLLNKKNAGSWRNAASRSRDDIYSYFAEFS